MLEEKPRFNHELKDRGRALVIVPRANEEAFDLYLRTAPTYRHTHALTTVREVVFCAEAESENHE